MPDRPAHSTLARLIRQILGSSMLAASTISPSLAENAPPLGVPSLAARSPLGRRPSRMAAHSN